MMRYRKFRRLYPGAPPPYRPENFRDWVDNFFWTHGYSRFHSWRKHRAMRRADFNV